MLRYAVNNITISRAKFTSVYVNRKDFNTNKIVNVKKNIDL